MPDGSINGGYGHEPTPTKSETTAPTERGE